MRTAALLLGLVGVVGGASAGDLGSQVSDAAQGRLMFETRFGGEHTLIAQRSFQLQFGTERQLNAGTVPFRTEYRPSSGQVLVNGMDLKPMLFSHQVEEGGIASAWAGWLPLAIVATGVTFVVIDGHNNDLNQLSGSGSGG
jgi:hypothetical protein